MISTKRKIQVVTNTQLAVATLALFLAGGLAFGLGGREHATRFLSRLRKDISER